MNAKHLSTGTREVFFTLRKIEGLIGLRGMYKNVRSFQDRYHRPSFPEKYACTACVFVRTRKGFTLYWTPSKFRKL